MSDAPRDFPRLAGQCGLATYAQLRAAGWSESQIRQARSTVWRCPFPSVAAPHRGPLDPATLLVAAGLWAGRRAVLTGLHGLREHGLAVSPGPQTLFLVPASGRARTQRRARVVRTTRAMEVARRNGIVAIAPAARALADAAVYERVSPKDLEALTISALHRGLATPESLDLELWQRPRSSVAAVRKGLDAFVGGAWSRPEAALRRIWDAAPDLPELLTNVGLERLRDGTLAGCPDGYVEALGCAFQVHSSQYHQGTDDRGNDRWARTVEKDSELIALGVRVVGVSPWTLYNRPAQFLARVREVVALGPVTPLPAVRVVAAPPRTGRAS